MSSLSTLSAVDVAVESIKVRKDLPEKTKKEAIERLINMSGRDWYIRWDKESIIKALNDYKEKTGRAPTVTNLVETGMPKNLTIQSHFHMRASEFLKQQFPENRNLKENAKPYSKFGFETEEEWLNCFAEQFKKHLCPDMCSKKYDLLRDKGTPTWSTIAKHCKMTSWKELMEAAGVKYLCPSIRTAENVHVCNVTSPTITKLEEINKKREQLNSELYNMLVKKK